MTKAEETHTSGIMPESNPYSFRASDGHQTTTIRGSYNPVASASSICGNKKSLTERNRASNLSGEVPIVVPRWTRVCHQRRGKERIHAQSLYLKHLVRLLNNLPQPDRFLQLGLPLQPRLGRLGVQGVQASHSSIMVNRARVHSSSVADDVGTRARAGRSDALVWTLCLFFTTERQQPATSLGWRVRECRQCQKVKGNGLYYR